MKNIRCPESKGESSTTPTTSKSRRRRESERKVEKMVMSEVCRSRNHKITICEHAADRGVVFPPWPTAVHRSWKALPSASPSAPIIISHSSVGTAMLLNEIRRAGARAKLVARTRRSVRAGDVATVGDVGEGMSEASAKAGVGGCLGAWGDRRPLRKAVIVGGVCG